MHPFITKLITNVFKLGHRLQLPVYRGTYFVSPEPPYLSQFVDIYPSSITGDTPLTNKQHIKKYGAKNAEEFTFWTWRNCGVVCVKMLLAAKGKAKNKTVMDLTNEGIKLGGYIVYENGKFVDKGWFHHSLVSLLEKYGIKAVMKKWQSIEAVAKDILANKFVILSIMAPGRCFIKEDGSFQSKENAKFGGHLLLATGIKMNGKKVEGIYTHDPRGLEKYQKDTLIPTPIFNKIFTHRTIVAD